MNEKSIERVKAITAHCDALRKIADDLFNELSRSQYSDPGFPISVAEKELVAVVLYVEREMAAIERSRRAQDDVEREPVTGSAYPRDLERVVDIDGVPCTWDPTGRAGKGAWKSVK